MKDLVFLVCFGLHPLFAQTNVSVFVSGAEGYDSYRIPAMVAFPDGELLAFCEGRVHSASDFGNVDIVLRRSTDHGLTWSALQVLVDNDSIQAGNPAPVIDFADPVYPAGRIFLFYNTGDNHESEVRRGKGLREVWYKTSTDRGRTWSDGVNITLQVHRPKNPSANPSYVFDEDWRSYANTPGHATQFSSGVFRGRIFVAANHSSGNPDEQYRDYVSHGYYTDDHGRTFHLGADVPVPGSNEATAAVLSGDRLMMNMRNQRGDIRSRIVAVSNDGGASWDSAWFDHRLPDPVCQGSLLHIGTRNGKNTLAFCNAADTSRRRNLTLRISDDDGASWSAGIKVPGLDDEKRVPSAYCDIAKVRPGTIGVLFEKDDYSRIVFTAIEWR